MLIPFPLEAVPVSATWYSPIEVPIRLKDGRIKKIKVRRSYTLRRVRTGVATIDVRSAVLTPVNDPQIRVKLMQRLNHGVVRFDVDAGRLLRKEMDWDETVVSFSGPESQMDYVAEFTEELIKPEPATAVRSTVPVKTAR